MQLPLDLPKPHGAALALTRHAAGHPATVIVAATHPFAQTSYARARLLRQLHASGLLTEQETEQSLQLLGVAN